MRIEHPHNSCVRIKGQFTGALCSEVSKSHSSPPMIIESHSNALLRHHPDDTKDTMNGYTLSYSWWQRRRRQ